ncbi:MAG: hypothetical protein MI751_11825, partial [Pseudomonadales bacterium]|nr:hypothetical protein [Pseudomonadales bacterium]
LMSESVNSRNRAGCFRKLNMTQKTFRRTVHRCSFDRKTGDKADVFASENTAAAYRRQLSVRHAVHECPDKGGISIRYNTFGDHSGSGAQEISRRVRSAV